MKEYAWQIIGFDVVDFAGYCNKRIAVGSCMGFLHLQTDERTSLEWAK